MKKNWQSEIKVVCAWCGADMGTKDGKGTWGVSHGICKKCAKAELAKVPKKPAPWNLIGRFLERRRYVQRLEAEHAAMTKADETVNERDNLRQAIEGNWELMTWSVLHGRQGVHWIDYKQIAEIQDRVANEPEMKIRWN